ncbi:MAG: PhzF family phenazine biosynthesis protein [Planctomycetota bacterium]|jgi:trans-2,3-dihydro-3-hydroxyanthranilate isomerase
MPNYRYHLVDVFADQPFAGHALAVFPEANGMSVTQMQGIARELNLRQTVFCTDPEGPDADTRMRIFTPEQEVSMAGHPVVGAHYILAATGRFPLGNGGSTVHVELDGGVLPIDIVCEDGRLRSVLWGVNHPSFSAPIHDRDQVAAALSIPGNAIGPGELPILVVDNGLPWLLIPVRDLRCLRALEPCPDLCADLAAAVGTERFVAFTQDTRDPNCAARTRNIWFGQFAPSEDPASGCEAAALAAYLTHQGVLLAAPTATVHLEQDGQIGRLGRVVALVDVHAREISRVRVGGRAVHVADGEFYLP